MNILGLQYHNDDYFHDASAALYSNGKISMYEEERFNKIKHSPCVFPYNSIYKLLFDANLNITDIDIIVLPLKVDEKTVEDNINRYFMSNKKYNFLHCDHHLSHFINSYSQSKFNNAAGIVIDADGDNYNSIAIFDAVSNNIKCIKSFSTEQSLGQFYQTAAEYCGFGRFGEGKLMGLAAFGNSLKNHFLKWNDKTNNIDTLIYNNIKRKHQLIIKNNCKSKELIKYLYNKPISNLNVFFKKTFYPYKKCIHNDEIIYYKDFAATIQDNYNTILLKLIEYTKKLTGKNNLVLSGGCIQNCIGNNLIIKSGLFENVFCSSVSHDSGISLGNAIFGSGNFCNNQRICFSNSSYQINDISQALLNRIKITNISKNDIANDIISGKIIGWFQNNAELGPRALGHRSIIANPSIRENLTIINRDIKHRDMFRPLAPIILASKFKDVFDTNNYDLCNYMLRTLTIQKEFQNKLCAVCHIDNTTRPQILFRKDNTILYELIELIYNKKSIPGIISTSFNDKDVPIVETLDDAIQMLLKTDAISYVVFEGSIKITRI